MRFLAVEKLSAHKYKTPEGYLVCTDAILSRTGKQQYARREIFGDDCDDPDRVIDVDRKSEDVFDEKAMASFENKPICIEHPDENVNISNFNELAVGFVRDIHKGKDNGQDVMMGTLVITNDRAIELVESGEYAELSCGYDIDIDDEPNPCQRNIRGNHVALCKQGRAGNARIVDSIDDEHVVNTIKGIVFKNDGLTAKSFSKFENGGDGTYELNDGYFVEYLIANRHNPKMHSSLKHYSDGDKTFAASKLQDGRVVFEGFNTKFTPRLKAAAEAYFRINDSQGDSMDYSKKTKQGYDVVAIYRANGRLYAIAKRANDYLIAAGYDTTSGTWAQGYYDFRNEDEAADWLREEHPGVRRAVDGKDAEPESKPAHDAWTDVYKQFEALIMKYFPNSAKINAEVDKLYAQHEGDADWDLAYKKWRETATEDAVHASDSKKLFEVSFVKDGVTYIRKVRANDLQDAIEKATDRLSPTTYRALKELGVGPNQWKNMSQEQASAYIAQRRNKNTQHKSGSNEPSSQKQSQSEASGGSLSKAAQKFLSSDNGRRFAEKGLLRRTANKKEPYIDVKPSEVEAAKEALAAKGLTKVSTTKERGYMYIHVDPNQYNDYLWTLPVNTKDIRDTMTNYFSDLKPSFDENNDSFTITFDNASWYRVQEVARFLNEDLGIGRAKSNNNTIVITKKTK